MNQNKKWLIITVVVLAAVIIMSTGFSYAESNEIPSWIKAVAGAWANDEITDSEYSNAMSFLIEQEIIRVKQDVSKSLILNFENKITLLEQEIDSIGLDNSVLLNGIVEKEQQIETIKIQFSDYKESHSHKMGNIGGAEISKDTVYNLLEKIKNLESIVQELEEELRNTK